MDLLTKEELRSDPRGSLGRILAIRRTVEEAETSAIAFLIGRGWSMSNVGWMLGRSRQAVSQRMQRSLVTSMPHAELRDAGRVRREASRREQLLDSDRRIDEAAARRERHDNVNDVAGTDMLATPDLVQPLDPRHRMPISAMQDVPHAEHDQRIEERCGIDERRIHQRKALRCPLS